MPIPAIKPNVPPALQPVARELARTVAAETARRLGWQGVVSGGEWVVTLEGAGTTTAEGIGAALWGIARIGLPILTLGAVMEGDAPRPPIRLGDFPQPKPDPKVVAEFDLEFLKQQQLLAELSGNAALAQLLNVRILQLTPIVQGSSHAQRTLTGGLNMVASTGGTASTIASSSVDKTWWTEKDGAKKPERGDRRWFIENGREGFRVTQLQEWNGSDWRPMKLKGERIPLALLQKLDELNRGPVAVVATASRTPARAATPQPPTYTPSPGTVSADVIMANEETLMLLPYGEHTLYVDTGGRLGMVGAPITLKIGPDPDSGMRRWMVVGQDLASLSVNLRRTLERLDGTGAQVAQIIAIIRKNSWGVIITVNTEGQWQSFVLGQRLGCANGQHAYEIRRMLGFAAGMPVRFQVHQEYVYHRFHGWREGLSGAASLFAPPVLTKALQIVNDRLAHELESAPPQWAPPEPSAAPQPNITPLTRDEIEASAEIIADSIDYGSAPVVVSGQLWSRAEAYMDSNGRVTPKQPTSALYFRLHYQTRGADTFKTIDLTEVEAISGGSWLWIATAEKTNDAGNTVWRAQQPRQSPQDAPLSTSPPPIFPLETVLQILRRASEILGNRAY